MEMIVKLIWDEDELGPEWMNLDNLSMLLYTDTHTNRELCKVEPCSVIGSK